MFRFGKASWRKGCCDSCPMYIYEGNGPVASVPSQMRRCNTRAMQLADGGHRRLRVLSDGRFYIRTVLMPVIASVGRRSPHESAQDLHDLSVIFLWMFLS